MIESWQTRLHWWWRWQSFPFRAVVPFIPAKRVIVDLGCGFGILTQLLAQERSRKIIAIDIAEKKLAVARQRLQNYHNVTVTKTWSKIKADVVIIVDVLYLLSNKEKQKLLKKVATQFRPQKLIIAFVPKELSWQYWLALMQEWVMVRGLRLTQSEKGVINFETVKWLRGAVRQCGFNKIKLVRLPTPWPWWHKHLLAIAHR